MVHNGIEYGDMQLICEAYHMLSEAGGLSNDELYDVFDEWNRGDLQSYLIEISRDIFSVADDQGDGFLVDKVLDKAGAKGTGKWMSQLALDLGVPSTLVTNLASLYDVYPTVLDLMGSGRPCYHAPGPLEAVWVGCVVCVCVCACLRRAPPPLRPTCELPSS